MYYKIIMGCQVELGHLVLKRFLLLALLLDRAVTGGMPCPKGTPLLFRRGQPIKSSVQVGASCTLKGAALKCFTPQAASLHPACKPVPFSVLTGLTITSVHIAFLNARSKLAPDYLCLRFSSGMGAYNQATQHFLRGRMHGEGDTMRHLASMGFRLKYEQDPRTEFDFAVANLGVDLRSGVRLLRMAELLAGTF